MGGKKMRAVVRSEKRVVRSAILIFCLLSFVFLLSGAQAQAVQSYPDDELGLQPKLFDVGFIKLYGDGKLEYGDIFFGVAYKTPKNIVYPQAGFSGNIFFSEQTDATEGRVAFNIGFGFWDLFYVGGFYDFWQSGIGWQSPDKISTGGTINVDLGKLKELAGI